MGLDFNQIILISELIDSTPRYVILRGYRMGIEIALGRRLTVKETRKLYGHLQNQFLKLEEEGYNDDSG